MAGSRLRARRAPTSVFGKPRDTDSTTRTYSLKRVRSASARIRQKIVNLRAKHPRGKIPEPEFLIVVDELRINERAVADCEGTGPDWDSVKRHIAESSALLFGKRATGNSRSRTYRTDDGRVALNMGDRGSEPLKRSLTSNDATLSTTTGDAAQRAAPPKRAVPRTASLEVRSTNKKRRRKKSKLEWASSTDPSSYYEISSGLSGLGQRN